ncbi:peptidyl-tRNA hydrolase [Patescibacteria group bacterium]|nr:peptidyl-tRNA hydrolase [Patescibacteria group bacterium]
MFLVVGLGNPGEQYVDTRHNVGFMVLDTCRKSDFLHATFLKPQTFMNNSGKDVKELYVKYNIQDTKYIVVIHDDIDLQIGKIKISKNSSSAGHKGVESIIKEIGTKDFIRIRIGIQPERGKPDDVENFVLKEFTKKELPLLQQAIKNSLTALDVILQGNIERAMSEYNT